MKKVFTAFLLIGLLFSCRTAQIEKIQLGMSKDEVAHHLRTYYGTVKTASARILPDGQLEETIQLKEGYDIFTYVFIDRRLKEWYTIDSRTIISPMPYTEAPLSTEDKE